jgi:hypothetical protein
MKKLLIIIISLIPFLIANPQEIGDLAPEKEPEIFPDNALGLDVMFGEGGVGFGGFYRRQLSSKFTAFVDFSISESKEDNEFQYYDIFGNPIQNTLKKNRVFLIPVTLGVQFRLFEKVIHDNLRPYINAGVGPSIAITTPNDREFFNAFGYAQTKFAAGGYVGFGANFGIDKASLLGINLRYYVAHFFDEGVETYHGRFRNDIGSFYLTINFGFMY